MSKGRIVRAGRQRHEAGQSLVIMTLPVTAELIPSFRIVAYYYVLPGEIVADSVWVDVKDTCMGTVSVPCWPGGGSRGLGGVGWALVVAGVVLEVTLEGSGGALERFGWPLRGLGGH